MRARDQSSIFSTGGGNFALTMGFESIGVTCSSLVARSYALLLSVINLLRLSYKSAIFSHAMFLYTSPLTSRNTYVTVMCDLSTRYCGFSVKLRHL